MIFSNQHIAASPNLPSISSFHGASSTNSAAVYGGPTLGVPDVPASHTGDALGKALASVGFPFLIDPICKFAYFMIIVFCLSLLIIVE